MGMKAIAHDDVRVKLVVPRPKYCRPKYWRHSMSGWWQQGEPIIIAMTADDLPWLAASLASVNLDGVSLFIDPAYLLMMYLQIPRMSRFLHQRMPCPHRCNICRWRERASRAHICRQIP